MGQPQTSRFSSALNLTLTLGFLEFLNALWWAQYIPTNILHYALTDVSFLAIDLPFFLLRLFCLHLLLAVILWGILEVFDLQHRRIFYFWVGLYGFFHVLVYHPQAFEEFPFLNSPISFFVRWLDPLSVTIFGFVGLFFLALKIFRTPDRLKFLQISIVILISAFLVYGQDPRTKPLSYWLTSFNAKTTEPSKQPKHLNIILLSVDSLRADAQMGDLGANPHWAHFLGSSYRFQAAITPVPKTQGALTAVFRGETPVVTDVRGYFRKESLDTDAMLKRSLVADLKDAGYRTQLMLDASQYVQFEAGKIFDQVQIPAEGLRAFVMPLLARSRLLFGFFDNAVSALLLPELRSNQAMYTLTNPQNFTFDVQKKLIELSNQEQPFFLMAHTSMLHWPMANIYPYYPTEQNSSGEIPRSMSTTLGAQRRFPVLLASLENRAFVFKKLYEAGLRQVQGLYLEPLLQEISKLGLLENSIVVVMADHGEAFSDLDERVALPSHGNSLIRGYDSERAYIAVRTPEGQGTMISKSIGLVDLMPTLLRASGVPVKSLSSYNDFLSAEELTAPDEKIYYTESDPDSLRVYSDERLKEKSPPPPSVLLFDREKEKFFLNPESEGISLTRKHRAVLQGENRLTLYWTRYGYRLFLCERAKDPKCEENQMATNPQLFGRLWLALQQFLKKDLDHGLLPSLKMGHFPWAAQPLPVDFGWLYTQKVADKNDEPWVRYQKATEMMHQWHDFVKSTEIFVSLATDETLSPTLREMSEQFLVDACNVGGLLPSSNAMAVIEKLNSQAPRFKNSFLGRLLDCAKKMKMSKDQNKIQQQIERNNAEAASVVKEAFVPKTGDNPWALFEKKSLPPAERVEKVYEQLQEIWEYDLIDRQSHYYKLSMALFEKEDPPSVLPYFSLLLAERSVPLDVFQHLISGTFSDDLKPGAFPLQPRDVKKFSLLTKQGPSPFSWQNLERSLFLIKSEPLVCGSKHNLEVCQKIQKTLALLPETKWWRLFIQSHERDAKNPVPRNVQNFLRDKKTPHVFSEMAKFILDQKAP